MSGRRQHRNVQLGWEAVRSQLMTQFTRPEAPPPPTLHPALSGFAREGKADHDPCFGPVHTIGDAWDEPEAPSAFSAELTEPYYGPTRPARAAVNRLLGLGESAGEAQWQRTLAGSGLELLVDALGNAGIDVETRSLIALIVLDGLNSSALTRSTELLARLRWQLRRDGRVQARMRYWWTHMRGSTAVMEALA